MESIVFDEALGRIGGVRMKNGTLLKCKKGVISSTGYVNTMANLVEERITTKYNTPRTLPVRIDRLFHTSLTHSLLSPAIDPSICWLRDGKHWNQLQC